MNTSTKGYIGVFAVVAALVAAFAWAAGLFSHRQVTAQHFVNLQEGKTPHAGFRRAHAKGICITGDFISNGNLAPFSEAQVFASGSTPFVGRYSIGGGNPLAPDLASPVRSLALSLQQTDGQQWRTAMNTPPVLAVGTPDAFFQQLQALQPDPATGKPDRARLGAFFAQHPESQAFLAWQKGYKPTNSFATEQFHSINAFYLVDSQGKRHAVRWAAVPLADATPALDEGNANALQDELRDRLKQGPVQYALTFTFANPDDMIDNGAIPWEGERKTIVAGTISIKDAEDQSTGSCNNVNFDPLVLPSGLEASNDPILRARGSAYAESFRRRARETFLEAATAS